jgi:hypothetical protein
LKPGRKLPPIKISWTRFSVSVSSEVRHSLAIEMLTSLADEKHFIKHPITVMLGYDNTVIGDKAPP